MADAVADDLSVPAPCVVVPLVRRAGRVPRWHAIELQGELASADAERGGAGAESGGADADASANAGGLAGKVLGQLEASGASASLVIGNHRLDGKASAMPKPMAVLRRVRQAAPASDDGGEPGAGAGAGVHYQVVGLVESRLLFKTRPKPVVEAKPAAVGAKRARRAADESGAADVAAPSAAQRREDLGSG